VLRPAETWVGGEQLTSRVASLLEGLPVGSQVRNPQRWQTVLLRAEQIPGPTQIEIHLRQREAVGGSGEGVQPRAGRFRLNVS
jgi:hypothetical protein